MNKLAQQMVSYIDVTGKALGVATSVVKEAETAKKAAAERINPLIDLLIANGLIKESDRKKANDQLVCHSDSLDVTMNIVEEMADRLKQANAKITALNNGQPVDTAEGTTKKASKDEDPDRALLDLVPALAAKYS